MVEHLGNRPVLNMDQLAEMSDVRPRLEKGDIKLPSDSRGEKNRIYFFSIDGTLRGNRFTGCLFAGECIMVQATSFEQAFRIAKDGLNDSVEIAKQYFDELNRSVVVASPVDASLQVDVGGRRYPGEPSAPPDLATDPKLKAMIAHIIGGKPWRN